MRQHFRGECVHRDLTKRARERESERENIQYFVASNFKKQNKKKKKVIKPVRVVYGKSSSRGGLTERKKKDKRYIFFRSENK